jgi:hypothetical protein
MVKGCSRSCIVFADLLSRSAYHHLSTLAMLHRLALSDEVTQPYD